MADEFATAVERYHNLDKLQVDAQKQAKCQEGGVAAILGIEALAVVIVVSIGAFSYSNGSPPIRRHADLAVVTTICGIGLRILHNQVRRDPVDTERTARHELAEMTMRVRGELKAASRELPIFSASATRCWRRASRRSASRPSHQVPRF